MSDPSRTLYGAPISPFVRKVRVALAEKKLSFNLIPVSPFGLPQEHKARTPLGKIPFYEENGKWLVDSSIIIA